MKLTREQLLVHLHAIVDDSLNVQHGHALRDDARFVVWQNDIRPMVIAVQSYLGVRIDDEEAAEHATDYLNEINWFAGAEREPDYII